MILSLSSKDVEREDLRSLVLRGLRSEEIGLTPCWPKLNSLAIQAVNYGLWVCYEENRKAVAHLCAVVTENPLFYGQQCTVVAWYSEKTGAGWELFKHFEKWSSDKDFKSIVLSTNYNYRLNKILEKRGWRMCPSYLKTK